MRIQNSKLKIQKYKTFAFLLAILIFNFLLLSFHLPNAIAQVSSTGTANHIDILDEKIENGNIVVATPNGYKLSTEEYDPEIFGIVSTNPAIALITTTNKNSYPVVSYGNVFVKVSNVNGPIKKGDYVTSSRIKGTGMRASRSGIVIGQAMEDAIFDNSKAALIPVMLNIHQAGGNSLLDIFNLGKIATYEAPTKVVQYTVAAVIMLLSFGAGSIIFAKAVNTGLEALGRNPLASRTIQFSIVLNLILIVVIVVAGASLAYLVIRL